MELSERRPGPRLPCVHPFEGVQLCGTCRRSPKDLGLRRCSRLVARSPAMRSLLERAAPLCDTDASVVLQGETGTGKEVIARALHANGRRRAGPFVAVNVATLPAELLESELFGHVRGAFTGAVSTKKGLFEDASGGTLFLDEIAELPLPLQAKLLRVLQERELRRLGDARPIAVDVRVISATHRDLRGQVERGLFREDLFYRLKVFALHLPPLRERPEDVLPLAEMFASRFAPSGARFAPEVLELLRRYPWPGNVRELGNAVEHAVVLARGGDIQLAHLPEELLAEPRSAPSTRPGSEPQATLRSLAEVERAHVLAVLDACAGNQAEAARVLGIGRNTLWRKLREYAAIA
ncbi:MAG: sigma-54 dependent transcriptional regulator [Byssovorax sp.]